MKFYRPLKRIEAITFDLDDTLYDNYDVIRRTDTETLKSIQGFHPRWQTCRRMRSVRCAQNYWRRTLRFITT